MEPIAFIDTEIEPNHHAIIDIGGIRSDGVKFHSNSIDDFINFLSGASFICGHNILNHDIKYISDLVLDAGIDYSSIIDTLHLSPLLFPNKPYHALLKDDKLQTTDTNNPLNDAIKARDLLYDEIAAFDKLDNDLKAILYLLLHDKKEFEAFFRLIKYNTSCVDPETLIRDKYADEICKHSDLSRIISDHAIELAYSLTLIKCDNKYSLTPYWVLKAYPDVERVMSSLRNKPCLTGCAYCDQALDIHKGLKKYFGFESFRTFGGEPLQEDAVRAAVNNKSLLAIFPTGGGKSITFQIPALMSGENTNGLTVIISPLQALMKDQVDNLEKAGITDAVTINGLLDPIERSKSFERVEGGNASMLYISPESLRSKSIERLILGRRIARFVIDEAHCFSSWGQDFRVDYLYIGDFIQSIQLQKNLSEGIPVSCFTATAKQKVIEDIRNYFKEKLSIELEIYSSNVARTNLRYKVLPRETEEEKYNTLRNLIEEKDCPTIIYVSRTRRAFVLAERLSQDGYDAKPYHGKMDIREKTANQNAFVAGEVPIMVATSAFGMGVDKKDIGMVIHYEISDSLENYIQEAGRAGRNENITAECYILFNEEDLSKHFILLNQTKLNIKEIQQIWKALKDLTKFRDSVSNSALEIARKAGWDDRVHDIETKVRTAIAALENADYLKRGTNQPRIYANSIQVKNAQEAIDRINASQIIEIKDKESAVRIIKKLFSSKSRKKSSDDVAESRIDYIADHLGLVKSEVIKIINLLREEKILADAKDLSAFIKKGANKNRSLEIVQSFGKLEKFLATIIDEQEKEYHIKLMNEQAEVYGCKDVSPYKLKTIINFWAIIKWIKRSSQDHTNNHIAIISNINQRELKEKLAKRYELARFIVEFLYNRSKSNQTDRTHSKEEVSVEFSVHEIKEEFQKKVKLFEVEVTISDIEDALFYLSRIGAINIEGGFLVIYNRLNIHRIEKDNKKRYKNDDYNNLNEFYENKVQQIHIVGEYAKKMIEDHKGALQFVKDYFQLNYASFLHKHFKGSRQNEIKRSLSPAKFRQLFGELSPAQLNIINDKKSKHIVVAAGPGSGKTRVLVHKLASLLLMEDVKQEQLLMLTFSRASATVFKKRLLALIGNAASYIEIKTFHSYCFDILGQVGSLTKSETIIKTAIEKINRGEVESSRITYTALVIDEAQDMDADEYALINALMDQNDGMRVIAVGDDDQNIYEFRGASAKYLFQFIKEKNATKYELVENYRSKRNLVKYTNEYVKTIRNRLKETPIIAVHPDNGVIRLFRHQGQHLITPLVSDILASELTGTTCILTKTNDQALQITGLLLKNRMPAKLIQTNDGFSLYNLQEVRFFLQLLEVSEGVYVINAELWDKAKHRLTSTYQTSSKLPICLNLIKEFEVTNPKKKYRSDLVVFIRESKLEDFFHDDVSTIFVSTIHKAKGKEFDNVFLMLENMNPRTDPDKRQLYVAMTRAKQNLTIHTNGNYLNHIDSDELQRIDDGKIYPPPKELTTQLTYKDIWLDYFNSRQNLVSAMMSGDDLVINGNECRNTSGKSILKFSRRYMTSIEEMKQKGYTLKKARVNFILHWQKEGVEQEIKIILPELYFER